MLTRKLECRLNSCPKHSGMIKALLYDGSIKCFKDDCHEIMTFGAFDLLEGLDVVVLRAVHDREDLGDEAGFTAGPLARGTVIS